MLPARWSELQVLLDEALDASAEQRLILLQKLEQRDADLAGQLRALLGSHEQAQQEDFLADTLAPALQAPALKGRRLGPWTLLEPLGEGGMGVVWLARRDDGRYAGKAAVKLLNLTLAGAMRMERFRREGHILARLAHAHIAHLLDAGVTAEGQPYLVIEHVQGQAIDAYCDAQRLSVSARITLFLTLLDAVSHAHSRLVVHRDIKPSNVMISDQGQVKLLDFGIAKLLAADDSATANARDLTRDAGALLSPGYAAPEQLQDGDITTATDVYALGVLLFVLLSGKHPRAGAHGSAAEALHLALVDEAPRLSAAVQPRDGATEKETAVSTAAAVAAAAARSTTPTRLQRQLRGDLDNILAKALQRDPAQRYASAQAYADDLNRHLAHQPVQARAPSLTYRMQRFVQRQRKPLLVAAVAFAALAVVSGQAWQQLQLARLNDTRAQTVDGLLQSLFEGMSPDTAANRNFSAQELLDRGQAFLEKSEALNPATRRTARLRMAGLYRDIGAYAKAAESYTAELALARQAGEAQALAAALWNLADLRLKLRDFQAAEPVLDELQAQLASNRSEALAGQLALLRAELWLGTNRLEQAVQAYAQADDWLARATPPDLELQARSAHGHGWALRLAGRLGTAAEHLQHADALYARRGERAKVDRLHLQVQIGALDNWQGRYERAATRLRASHAELVQRLGPQHPTPVLAVSELAVAELRQGHFEAARQWLTQLRGATGPADRWRDNYAAALEARIHMYEGNSVQAEPELRSLLAAKLREDGRPGGQSEALRRLHGESLLRLSRTADAVAVLRESESQLVAMHKSAQHNSVAATQVLLACALARQGDLAGARTLWSQAAPLLREQLGEQHPFALAAAAYAALAHAGRSAQERQALADRVQAELGWQDGAQRLAQWLRNPPDPPDWAHLPAVL
jgi:serine/threonine protein kinase